VLISNFLQQGSAGIREMMIEADKLGITFSRLDSAKVEAMNDAFVKVKFALIGIGYQLIIRLAGPLQWISDKLVAFIKTFKGGARELAFRSLNWITLKIDDAIKLVNSLAKAFLFGLKTIAPIIGKLIVGLGNVALIIIDNIPAIVDFFKKFEGGCIKAVLGLENVRISAEDLRDAEEDLKQSQLNRTPLGGLINWFRLKYKEGQYQRQLERDANRRRRLLELESSMYTGPGSLGDSVSQFQDTLRRGVLTAQVWGDNFTEMTNNAYNNFKGLSTGVNSWWLEMQKASPEAKKIAEGHKMNTDALADLNDVELKELKTLKERNRTVKEGLFLNAKLAYTAVKGAAIVKAQESSSYLDKLGNEETARIKREESLTAQNERIMAANEKALDKSGNEEQVMTNSLLQELIDTIKNSRTGLDFATEGVD